MRTVARPKARQLHVMGRLRSLLVSYLANSGELARRGYFQLPEAPELPRLEKPEHWESVLEDFGSRLAEQRTALANAASIDERMRIVTAAFLAAVARIRSDLAWEHVYRDAGVTRDEELFARTAASRLRDAG